MNDALETLESRHDAVREQLAFIEDWVETLPLTNPANRRVLMRRIVDFLEQHVLVDAGWEEAHVFPGAGAAATGFVAEHRFVARLTRELDSIARGFALDGVSFRRATYKLIGLLEAHMDAEETVLLGQARAPVERFAELG